MEQNKGGTEEGPEFISLCSSQGQLCTFVDQSWTDEWEQSVYVSVKSNFTLKLGAARISKILAM
jgi:hypothetical protein